MCLYYTTYDRFGKYKDTPPNQRIKAWKLLRRGNCNRRKLYAPFYGTEYFPGWNRSSRTGVELVGADECWHGNYTGEINHGIHAYLTHDSALEALSFYKAEDPFKNWILVPVRGVRRDLVAVSSSGTTAVFTKVWLPRKVLQ